MGLLSDNPTSRDVGINVQVEGEPLSHVRRVDQPSWEQPAMGWHLDADRSLRTIPVSRDYTVW